MVVFSAISELDHFSKYKPFFYNYDDEKVLTENNSCLKGTILLSYLGTASVHLPEIHTTRLQLPPHL